jgi:protein ImuB
VTSSALRNRRYLALWLPFLPTDRLTRLARRSGGRRDELPMVVARLETNAMRVVAADRCALSLGLVPGLGLADARARVPKIEVHVHEPEEDLALLRHIADWCDRYGPYVAEEPPDTLILEIAGSAHLLGGEAGLKRDLDARLSSFGFAVRTAVAATSSCARAIARFGEGGIVPSGREREQAANLPVAALELPGDTLLALRRAGLMTLGDLAARPMKPLAARFGEATVRRLRAILGEIDPPLELARDLCARLELHGQGGRAFAATFFRADGATRRIEAMVGRPLRDPVALKKLFMTRLDSLADPVDPGFGFDMIKLVAFAGDPDRGTQIRFQRDRVDEEAVADLVDRLTARFGPGAVERFLPLDSHIPERAARRVAAISDCEPQIDWTPGAVGEPPLRPVLIFTPPQPVETVAEVPDGPPFRFRWRRILHEIARAEGPERIAPEWWRRSEPERSRDYYRVEDRQGHRFWLYREGIYGREDGAVRWFIHGLFP